MLEALRVISARLGFIGDFLKISGINFVTENDRLGEAVKISISSVETLSGHIWVQFVSLIRRGDK